MLCVDTVNVINGAESSSGLLYSSSRLEISSEKPNIASGASLVYSFPNKQIEEKFDHALEIGAPSGEAVEFAVGQKAIRSSAI